MLREIAISTAAVAMCAGGASAEFVTQEFLGPRTGSVGLGGENSSLGQTFTATVSGEFSSLDLSLRRNGADPVTLTANLWQVSSDTGLPIGPDDPGEPDPLAQASFSTTLTEDFETITFDFANSGVILDSGTQYAWTLISNPGGGGYTAATGLNDEFFADRGIVRLGGGTFDFMGNEFLFGERDVIFSARVIPVPGTASLLLASGAFVGTRRRRAG